MSLESTALGALGLVISSVGFMFVFRPATALAVQRRYAETISWRPPSKDPAYYEETRDQRREIFQLGGTVLLVVGALLLAAFVYATFFVTSVPR